MGQHPSPVDIRQPSRSSASSLPSMVYSSIVQCLHLDWLQVDQADVPSQDDPDGRPMSVLSSAQRHQQDHRCSSFRAGCAVRALQSRFYIPPAKPGGVGCDIMESGGRNANSPCESARICCSGETSDRRCWNS